MNWEKIGHAIRLEAEYKGFYKMVFKHAIDLYGWPSMWSDRSRLTVLTRILDPEIA